MAATWRQVLIWAGVGGVVGGVSVVALMLYPHLAGHVIYPEWDRGDWYGFKGFLVLTLFSLGFVPGALIFAVLPVLWSVIAFIARPLTPKHKRKDLQSHEADRIDQSPARRA